MKGLYYRIGPARAKVFVEAGCKTAENLLEAEKKGKIKLTKAQKIGLIHREVCRLDFFISLTCTDESLQVHRTSIV